MNDVTIEQINMAVDFGILIVLLVDAFLLLKNNKKLKLLGERFEILAYIKK